MGILVQEKPGDQLAGACNFVDRAVPDFCGRGDCLPCLTATKPTEGRCWREGTNYRIDCLLCKERDKTEAVYHGESGFSAYWRGRQHLEGFLRRTQGNPMQDHKTKYHPKEELKVSDFRMTIVANPRRPIIRLSREGISIAHTQKALEEGRKVILMNDKTAFYQPGVVRMRVGGVFPTV